jgi:hypothetical protein
MQVHDKHEQKPQSSDSEEDESKLFQDFGQKHKAVDDDGFAISVGRKRN